MNRIFIVFFLTVSLLTACAADRERLKRQAEDKRNIAAAYIGQKNYAAALRELLEAEKLYPHDPYLHNDMGLVYMEREMPELAVQHFKKALALKSDYSDAKNNLGVAHIKNGQLDEAISCLKELLTNLIYATPQNPLFNLGWAYYQKKDFAQAETYYHKALGLYEDGQNKDAVYVKTLHGLGLSYLARGQIQDAVVVLEKAVQFAPRIPEIHFELGRAYTLVQNYSKAVQSYQKVIELVPDRSLAREAAKATEEIKRTRLLN